MSSVNARKVAFRAGGTVTVALLVFIVRAFAATGGAPQPLALGVAMAAGFGMACGVMFGLRLRTWFWCTVIGLGLGMYSAAPLYFTVEAAGHDAAALLTLAFFGALGIAVGAFGEFIGYLHHLSHGRHPKDYPAVAPPSERDRLSH
jgi:hypothetical protein